ncbi:hypothetical protein [Salirhabdus salicampi]|uniref:hypothetical protein n=1 Tax=Salirhabdus salicampi TaxID=476102 RepID=UPI0020C3990A|nr:hypothetical protein [Salirhabdus salicampi]MCP8617514.1 hypothetical protein [Salirhabdus salicampi]
MQMYKESKGQNIEHHADVELPKSIKKALRYIKQDAPIEKVHKIEKALGLAIKQRLKRIEK